MRKMLAEFVRGDTQSIQMLARAHDMRYQAKVGLEEEKKNSLYSVYLAQSDIYNSIWYDILV